jgi:hypothetical protein
MYYIKEGHEIHKAKGRDINGDRIVEVYHHKSNTKFPRTVEHGDIKVTYISAGNKIALTHDELRNKKYWRDVIISNSVEWKDLNRELTEAYPKGRKTVLMDKAIRLGIPKADEVVDRYISGDVLRGR